MNLFQKKHDWILGGFEFLRADTTVEANPGSGGAVFAVDAAGATLHPYAKMEFGASGTQTPVSTSNPLPVVQTGTPGLPTGAATAAKQDTGNTSLATLAGAVAGSEMQVDIVSSAAIPITDNGGSLTIDAASLPLPTGAATAAKQDTGNASLAAISGQLPAALDGSGNLKVAIQSGGSGGTQYAEDTAHASGDLMTMAGAVRRDANTSLVGTDGDVAPLQVNAAGQLKTDGSAVTQPVSDAGGSLTVDSGQLPATLGQKAMTASMAVTLASDQTVIPINDNGGSVTVDGTVAVSGVTPGTAATSLGKAEDAAHSSGDVGVMALGVRKDADGAFGADLDYGPLQLDDNGYLKVNIKAGAGSGGTAATDDAAFTPGSGSGTPIMGFADETSPDSVDEGDVGVVRMTLARALHVNLRDSSGNELSAGAQYAEDAAHTTGDLGTMMLTVRKDTAAATAGADGDYQPPTTDASGRLHVNVGNTVNVASHAVTNAGTFAVQATVAAGATNIAKAEDAASADADVGVPAMAVRKATPANTSGTDGDYEMLQMSAGRLWTSTTIDAALPAGTNAIGKLAANSGVDIGDVDVTSLPNVTLAAGTNTNEMVGDAAHDAAVAGNPVRTGGRARTSDYTSVANDDTADFITDLNGKQVVLPYAIPENFVSGAITSAMTGTTSTSLIAAPASGLRNYITTIIVSNSHATVGTDVIIQDGNGGTTLMTIPAAAVYGGATITLPVPLRQPTTATAIYCANVTTGASTKVSAVGYKAP